MSFTWCCCSIDITHPSLKAREMVIIPAWPMENIDTHPFTITVSTLTCFKLQYRYSIFYVIHGKTRYYFIMNYKKKSSFPTFFHSLRQSWQDSLLFYDELQTYDLVLLHPFTVTNFYSRCSKRTVSIYHSLLVIRVREITAITLSCEKKNIHVLAFFTWFFSDIYHEYWY